MACSASLHDALAKVRHMTLPDLKGLGVQPRQVPRIAVSQKKEGAESPDLLAFK